MWKFITYLQSAQNFYQFSGKAIPWLGWTALIIILFSLYGGLVTAPADYQQGDAFRIIYVHVPAAWMSLFIYMVMASAGFITLIWRTYSSEVVAAAAAPLGASFTFLALVTGSLWGKPMWGTWWEWSDSRLMSELILLFLYLGFMALQTAIEDRKTAARACAVLALVGVVNIPIIHYSVEWWNTLHQGPTVTKFDKPSIHIDMLIPLLGMAIGFTLYFFSALLARVRCEIISNKQHTDWVKRELT